MSANGIGVVAVGGFRPPQSVLRNAGAGQPAAGDFEGLMRAQLEALQALDNRLAPTPQFVRVPFNANNAGDVFEGIHILNPWNGIIVNLETGSADIYQGSASGLYLFHLSASPNPDYIPLPPLEPGQISFKVRTGPCTGVAYIVTY